MNRPARFDGPRKATHVSSSAEPVEEAWEEENRAAIEASNEYARTHGLPLARYRLI